MTTHMFMTRKSNRSRGFTLVELMVVISIIGLLSSVILASLNITRYRAYDSRRFSDLRNVESAINAYFADNGVYPTTGSAWQSVCGSPFTVTAQNVVVPSIVAGKYIASIPVGPQMVAASLYDCYVYKSNGTDYKFMDYGPTYVGGKTPSGTLNDPGRSGAAWAVYSPGASTW